MTKDSTLKCQICGQPATGTADFWRCSASKYHYWRWRTDRLRQAKREWEQTLTPYQREVLEAFKSNQERARFLKGHTTG